MQTMKTHFLIFFEVHKNGNSAILLSPKIMSSGIILRSVGSLNKYVQRGNPASMGLRFALTRLLWPA